MTFQWPSTTENDIVIVMQATMSVHEVNLHSFDSKDFKPFSKPFFPFHQFDILFFKD
jgi:hypothetical protein